MNGIVVEVNQKAAVILADNGLFMKVKNEKYEIGQTVKIKEKRTAGSRWITGAASMVAAAVICTMGAFAYYTPTDYISLDVNPSVEYSINMFDRILDVKAANDDGEVLLSGLNLNNKTIDDGVRETLDKLIEEGYLSDDPDGGVVITTSSDKHDQAEQLAAELEQEIRSYLGSRKDILADVEAEAVEPARVLEAMELGVTPGKLNLVDKLQESTSSAINTEEWLNKPVKEINKAIKENRKQSREQDRSNAEGDQKERQAEDQKINQPKSDQYLGDKDKPVFDQLLEEDDDDQGAKNNNKAEEDRGRQKDDNRDDKDQNNDSWKNKNVDKMKDVWKYRKNKREIDD